MPICGVAALPQRCDVRAKYVSHLGSRRALHLGLFELPGEKRFFSNLLAFA